MPTDRRKQSLYFGGDLLAELEAESQRQDRSLSWIAQQALRIALPDLRKMPSAEELLENAVRRVG